MSMSGHCSRANSSEFGRSSSKPMIMPPSHESKVRPTKSTMRPTITPSLMRCWTFETEGQQGHAAAKGQSEHQRHVEPGKARASDAGHPVAQRQV